MRIAFITTCLEVGGAERIVTSLADSLARRGHHVLIVFLTGEAIILPTCKEIQVVGLGMSSAGSIVCAYIRLRRLLNEFKADVIHSHSFHANILARLLRLSITIPRLICTAHNTIEGGRLRMFAYRFTDRLADLSTNVSDEAVAAFVARKAVKKGRMITVHNGISTEEFRFCAEARTELRCELGVGEGCKLIIAVGKLCEQKDYPNLLGALTKLEACTTNYQLCIVGDGPLSHELKKMVVESGLSDHVRLLGVRHDVARLMSAADVFVLSSAWEGFGLVVAEAMACERVVVATDCGGVKEVLGEAGYLVAPRQPGLLAEALQVALNLSAVDSAEIGRLARDRVQDHYSLESAVNKWLKLYPRA